MNGLLLLIPVALGLGIVGLFAFTWALHAGQFDDLDGAAGRILFDDEPERTVTAPPREQPSPTKRPSPARRSS